MKTVFSNSEVSHVWARQSQDEGKGSNVYFTGPKIYSYGSHFCMGNIIAPGVVLLTDRSYSNSTAKHLGYVRYAVNHMRKLFVPHPEETPADNSRPEKNLKVWQARIKEHLETIAHPRKRPQTKEAARGSLAEIVRTVNEYLELTGQTLSKKWEPWNEAMRKEFLLYFAAAQDEQAAADLMVKLERARKAKERAARAAKEELYIKGEQALKAWMNGRGTDWYKYDHLELPVRLRATHQHSLDIDRIETSKGARVSYEAGKLLFAMIKAGKEVKGHDIDGYTVISINGVLKIGCHEIEMAEVHRFAKQEGWE